MDLDTNLYLYYEDDKGWMYSKKFTKKCSEKKKLTW